MKLTALLILLALVVLAAPRGAPDSEGSPALLGAPSLDRAAINRGGAPLPTQDPGELTSSIESGVASWYDDGPGFYAAVNSWRWGDTRYAITVCRQDDRDRCVTVTVRDFCGCPGARIVDLSPRAFSRLAPLTAGLVKVTVQSAGPAPTPPATETEELP